MKNQRRLMIIGGDVLLNAAVAAALVGVDATLVEDADEELLKIHREPVYMSYNEPQQECFDNYDMQRDHHFYNLRADTVPFDRQQQRRKALIANNKKQPRGAPKGARKREKRFVAIKW